MKQSYNIEIAGVKLNIVSADGAELVEATVAELEGAVQNMLRVGKNYSKLDALALCALDYCGELKKAEAKIKNLEAQIEILEAGRRIRGASEDSAAEAEAEDSAASAPEAKTEAAETADSPEEADAADAPAEEDGTSRDEKFRQLEALLGSQLKLDLGND